MKYDLYDCNSDDSARYVLGKSGSKPVYVVGLNPSTANKEKSDPTVAKTEEAASRNEYGGFVMTNLYPLRSTDPKELPQEGNVQLIKKNVRSILKLAKKEKELVIWAAWGDNITTRLYLFQALEQLSAEIMKLENRWIHFGSMTSKGHPRHPSRLSYGWKFSDFDIASYLKRFIL